MLYKSYVTYMKENNKVCSLCKEEKQCSDFTKFTSICIECRRKIRNNNKILIKEGKKKCPQCLEIKQLSEYYVTMKGYYYLCKSCSDSNTTKNHKQLNNQNNLKYIFYQKAISLWRDKRHNRIIGFNSPTELRDYLLELWIKSKGYCAYTNEPMDLKGYLQGNKNAVTIDRINPNKGYEKEDIALVKNIVNRVKTDLTFQELYEIVDKIKYNVH